MRRDLEDAPHFIYIYWGRDPGVPLYVGCTHNPAKRDRQHRQTQAWYGDVARLEVLQPAHPNRADGRLAESRAIAKLNPVHNVRCNRSRDWSTPSSPRDWSAAVIEVVKFEMVARDLWPSDLARLADIPVARLSRLLANGASMNVEELGRISRLFGTTMTALATRAGQLRDAARAS